MHDTTTRDSDLRQMLSERRRELQDRVQGRLRDVRTDQSHEVCDELERSNDDIHGDIELALLQMKAETLTRVDAALVQLDAGTYGRCFECDGEIAKERLRAVPFAVRCMACEKRREQEQGRAQRLAQTRGSFSLFSSAIGS
jgi:DnaK suppressor protein